MTKPAFCQLDLKLVNVIVNVPMVSLVRKLEFFELLNVDYVHIFLAIQTAKHFFSSKKKVSYKVAINFWFKMAKNLLNLCWLGTWASFLLQLAPNSYT